MSSQWLQWAPDHNPSHEMKKCDAPMICCSSIPRDKQMRLGKTNYFPTTPKLASVRVHGYQCLDKKAWNGIRHWSAEEVVTQNLCYCAILLFSYRKSSVVLYIPYHMLAIFILLWLLISHMFCSTCISLNWDMMLVLFEEYYKRQGMYQTCRWQSYMAPPSWKRQEI